MGGHHRYNGKVIMEASFLKYKLNWSLYSKFAICGPSLDASVSPQHTMNVFNFCDLQNLAKSNFHNHNMKEPPALHALAISSTLDDITGLKIQILCTCINIA